MEHQVEIVGEFTEEHARRVIATSYRIWKRVLAEQAEQRRRQDEAVATQAQDGTQVAHGA